MSERDDYKFADLHNAPALIGEIVQLENQLKQQTGQDITLIAYCLTDSASEHASCRAGLNE